jgi:hypothetical protein
MDLERELSGLELAWPETPELRVELGARTRRRRPWIVAVAVVLAAIAAAFAVPQSRGAILRFFHLGGVTIQVVAQLPAAQERPLDAGLGARVTRAQAERRLGRPLLLPPLHPLPPLHLQQQGEAIVSLVFLDRGRPVLLSELGLSDAGILKKVLASSTSIRSLRVAGGPAFWISGAAHVFLFPDAPSRLAGNVLIWQVGGLTLRLEGKSLTLARARALAVMVS